MSISEIELTTPLIQSLVREIIYALLIKQPFYNSPVVIN